jgi:thiol-disulfide isomerase/thioredoxin
MKWLIAAGLSTVFLMGTVLSQAQSQTAPTLARNSSQAQEKPLEYGVVMPEVIMQNVKGEVVKLSNLKGQAVVLNFWESWCGPCKQEMPVLDKLQLKYPKVTMIGANVSETRRKVEQFLAKTPVSYTIWMDNPDGGTDVGRLMAGWQGEASWSIPFTVIIDKEGVVSEVLLGFDGSGRELELAIREVL